MKRSLVMVTVILFLAATVVAQEKRKTSLTVNLPRKTYKFKEFVKDPFTVGTIGASITGIGVSKYKTDTGNFIEGNPIYARKDGTFNTPVASAAAGGLFGLNYLVYRKSKKTGRWLMGGEIALWMVHVILDAKVKQ